VIVMASDSAHRTREAYPRNEAAERNGAGVEAETSKPYAPFPKWRPGATFDGLPWA